MSPGETSRPPTGLRARKKERTRADIQLHALRLFAEQGFHATTVEQVAAAAEVAPSTVFRYFPRKEDLARLAEFHSLHDEVVVAFRAQPAGVSALTALRSAMRTAFATLAPEDHASRRERDIGLLEIPELWAANLPMVVEALAVIADLLAERTGRSADDSAVRSLTGATFGIGLEVLLRARHQPALDISAELDQALAQLETAVAM